MNKLASQIHAILFYKNEPVAVRELAKMVESEEVAVEQVLSEIKEHLSGSGLTLVEEPDDSSQRCIALTTAPEESTHIEKLAKAEIDRDLTAAELEALTIILYYGPVSKADIDYIRGVNSGTILRKVQVRGLVKKVDDPDRARGVLYEPTVKAMQHLGIEERGQLPEYEAVQAELKDFTSAGTEEDSANPFTTEAEQHSNHGHPK